MKIFPLSFSSVCAPVSGQGCGVVETPHPHQQCRRPFFSAFGVFFSTCTAVSVSEVSQGGKAVRTGALNPRDSAAPRLELAPRPSTSI